jgi:hypothetical protein
MPEPEQLFFWIGAITLVGCGAIGSALMLAAALVLDRLWKRRTIAVLVAAGSVVPFGGALILASPILLLMAAWLWPW